MIPLAILFSVSVLYIQGKSANLLSIGAVDFGIIVDSSVIIVENIYRHITARDADRTRPLIDRIIEASHEIERALFFSTLIIVCAFIPLFSMTGPGRGAVRPDGQHLRVRDLRRADPGRDADAGPLLVPVPQQEGGEGDVRRPDHEAAVPDDARPGAAASLPGAGGRWAGCWPSRSALIPTLGGEFMPPLEEGNLWIRALLPRTVTLQEAARMAPRLREVIGSIPEIRAVMSHVGRPDDGTDVTSYFNLEFNAPLIPMEAVADEAGQDLRATRSGTARSPARRSRTS